MPRMTSVEAAYMGIMGPGLMRQGVSAIVYSPRRYQYAWVAFDTSVILTSDMDLSAQLRRLDIVS
jgi:hypothetical protein